MWVSDATVHIPVLLEGVLAQLGDVSKKRIVDGTFGGGGYTEAFLEAGATVLGIDKDPRALGRAGSLQNKYKKALTLVHDSFANLDAVMEEYGWGDADAIVLDLGISSDQLDNGKRGFSYQKDGPLDMRMDASGVSAADVLNKEQEVELVRIFREYGEEPRAKSLANKIVHLRKEKPFKTTHDFLEVIEQVYPPRMGLNRRHPAQRIFQALRIAVNEELKAVEDVIPQAVARLAKDGMFIVVTFHSLEDRLVKRAFRKLCEPEMDMVGRLVAKAPFTLPVKKVKPSASEIGENVRARSAILRVIKRVEA